MADTVTGNVTYTAQWRQNSTNTETVTGETVGSNNSQKGSDQTGIPDTGNPVDRIVFAILLALVLTGGVLTFTKSANRKRNSGR